MKCLQALVHVLAHGMTHQAPHHEAQAGMTHQVSRQALALGIAQALVILAQVGQAQALVILAQVLHQAGIDYVVCRFNNDYTYSCTLSWNVLYV